MVEGLTGVGRTTLAVLQLNHPNSIALRDSLMTEGVFRHDFERGSFRNLVVDAQDGGFFQASAPASSEQLERMPGRRKPAGHRPHHWRAIDRNIPSQVASPHCLSPFFPAWTSLSHSLRFGKNYWTQEPMPPKIQHPVSNSDQKWF